MGLALGAAVPETLRLSGTVEIDSLRLSDDAVVTRAIQDRRQREVLLRNIEERHAERRLADVEGRPNVTVGAGLSRERQALRGDDFTGDPSVVGGIIGARDTDYLWRAGISVPIPLWQQNQGPRARAAAEVRLAEVEYDGLPALS
jgi:outer membrane protein TolC